METTYFSIDARQILVYRGDEARQAAGGGEAGGCYMVLPRQKRIPPAGRDNVIDFAACRRALEEGSDLQPDRAPEAEQRTRSARLPLLLDCIATAAVAAAAVAVVVLFLHL